MVRKCEPAYRVLAMELTEVVDVRRGEGEYDPAYADTPLRTDINRVCVAGSLMDPRVVKAKDGEGADRYSLELRDPSGSVYVWVDKYSPDVLRKVRGLTVPAYVMVKGKVKVYTPEAKPDMRYVSIKPEDIVVITRAEFLGWLLEAVRSLPEGELATAIKESVFNYVGGV